MNSSLSYTDRQCVCSTIRKAARTVTQIYDKALRPSGLRSTQFHILAEIRGAGETTATALASRLAIDQTTLTRSLALLDGAGFLASVPKPDGRVKAVRLTKKGEKVLVAALPLWAAVQKQMVGLIGSESWAKLSGELEGLARRRGVL